ncbi:MAG TPA: hypothetical protein VFG09_06980 [Thermodesulfovibrionales bacterium]|jgi:hypothetical protein|nr:hypothetical protein [Thermodesulfovibrionales bacterium]
MSREDHIQSAQLTPQRFSEKLELGQAKKWVDIWRKVKVILTLAGMFREGFLS